MHRGRVHPQNKASINRCSEEEVKSFRSSVERNITIRE